VGGANIQIIHFFYHGYLEEKKSMIHSFTVTFGAKYLTGWSLVFLPTKLSVLLRIIFFISLKMHKTEKSYHLSSPGFSLVIFRQFMLVHWCCFFSIWFMTFCSVPSNWFLTFILSYITSSLNSHCSLFWLWLSRGGKINDT
jgi:hypothetical protein